MIKLALIGKDIQHSRSPELYKRLIKKPFDYQLLDYAEPSLIPSVELLFKHFDGINITSPYKKHFIGQVKLTAQARELGAINCLRKEQNGFSGENTDFLAIMDILQKFKLKYQNIKVIILGNGVMSQVTQLALSKNNIPFQLFYRKITDNLDQLNLEQSFKNSSNKPGQKLVINTCAREFIFKGHIEKDTIFWDYNYNFLPHAQSLPSKTKEYIDGMEMLELQAVHAIAFWSVNSL